MLFEWILAANVTNKKAHYDLYYTNVRTDEQKQLEDILERTITSPESNLYMFWSHGINTC